ncbi:hypothetical protein Pmani_018432 [Petrolisthes manimaculis]|uniref:Endonuclease/exonuclease/phosphatase domain-containing protein n=1 Tax=Petrolisthes manimaculis TaxID=1843537 RepID=A0AAE1U8D2_9EUCA|nr:hypothetical protein Pmani_018432 [Petrolisthes manimaculis]
MILDESRDIFIVSESWLTEVNQKCITSEIRSSLGGYNFFSCPRTGRKGGGVAAFALGALDVKVKVTKPYKSFECLDLTVKTGSIVLRLVVMYRPPKLCTVSVFFEEFSELLETLIPAEGRLFICGDVNFHVDDVENRDAQRLLDLIHSLGLVQHMQVATHQKGHTLDLVITRAFDPYPMNIAVDNTLPSDHSLIKFSVDVTRPAYKRTVREVRDVKSIDADALSSYFSDNLFPSVGGMSSDEAAVSYNSHLETMLDTLAPARTKIIINDNGYRMLTLPRSYSPWWMK